MAAKTSDLVDAVDANSGVGHGPRIGTGRGAYTLGQLKLGQVKVSGAQPKRARIKVGGVYVTGDKATAAQLERAVAESAEMLDRLGRKMARAGVQLKAARDIPLFFADPNEPGRFLRKLNGKIDRGLLENGAFKVVD